MSKITLYCHNYPELHLGPGHGDPSEGNPGEIWFSQGFAVVDTDKFPSWEAWMNYGGNPQGVENLGENEEKQVAPESTEHVCPECGKGFGTRIALTGHLRSHKKG